VWERRHANGRCRTAALALAALALGLLIAATGTATAQTGTCAPLAPFNAAAFPAQPKIDNTFFPLTPGTRWVLEGTSTVGTPQPHRVTFVVTDLTKVIAGVRTRVVWDVDVINGAVAEAELAFFAQDGSGNVWTLGEYPEEYQGGVFTGAPSTWIQGVGDAQAGILLPGSPTTSTPEWLQGSVPSIDFLDCALVDSENQSTTVPAGSFSGVLVVHERSPLDPGGGTQVKYYAPNSGNVQIGAINDPQAEELVLVERTTLDPAALAAARQAALTLDDNGYRNSAAYAQTPRAELPPPPSPPAAVTTSAPTSSSPASPASPPPAAVVASTGQLEAPTRQSDYRSKITNPYFPISSFRSMTLRGTERNRRTGRRTTERVELRPSSRRVTIAGIRTNAVNVREYENGKLVERTIDYYAQDLRGNVWYFGERVDDIENGRVTGHEGQWQAGRNGARAGLFMPAGPKVGDSFQQERAPGVAEDTSTVVALGVRVRTPLRRFSNCMRTSDFGPLDRTRETKYYCRGIGLVREGGAPIQLVAYRRAR
jgi:hypothetical protein